MQKEHRTIRSFVRREGRLTTGQQRALLDLWPVYGVELGQQFDDLFSHCTEIVFEIGFGNGDALLELAQRNPHIQYIGTDVYRPAIGGLLLKLQQQEINNVKVFREDGVKILQDFFPNQSLSKINLFFPDPWPKSKHHKRRLVQKEFIELITGKLKKAGTFHFATDWQDYADYAIEVLQQQVKLENCATDGYFSARADRPITKFEQRGQRLGHHVFDIVMKNGALE